MTFTRNCQRLVAELRLFNHHESAATMERLLRELEAARAATAAASHPRGPCAHCECPDAHTPEET